MLNTQQICDCVAIPMSRGSHLRTSTYMIFTKVTSVSTSRGVGSLLRLDHFAKCNVCPQMSFLDIGIAVLYYFV